MSHFHRILANMNALVGRIIVAVAICFSNDNIVITIVVVVVDHIESSSCVIVIISCIFDL